jgi:hypothetical protein
MGKIERQFYSIKFAVERIPAPPSLLLSELQLFKVFKVRALNLFPG